MRPLWWSLPLAGGATADTIADGLVLTLVFRSDFTYTITEDPGPPEVVEVEDGIVTVAGSVLTLIPDSAPEETEDFTIQTLTSTDLTISAPNTSYDFNDDGTETPASLTGTFVKQ